MSERVVMMTEIDEGHRITISAVGPLTDETLEVLESYVGRLRRKLALASETGTDASAEICTLKAGPAEVPVNAGSAPATGQSDNGTGDRQQYDHSFVNKSARGEA